ncbi:MAG TPA: hypothetical protein VEK33_14040 [Terriglobales bacterium]|nr:hypothetical protein [Terriglobales bacterium]
MREKSRLFNLSVRHWLAFLLVLVWELGCSSSSSQPAPALAGLPTLSPAGESNSYWGTQGSSNTWQILINHNTNVFTAADLSNPAGGTIAGFFSILNPTDFLDLAQSNVSPPFQQFGYALEIPGRALLLRPGDNLTPLAALVPGSCLSINGTVTFQFVTLPQATWAVATDPAYGSLQATTSGNTWNFSSVAQSRLVSSPPTTITLPAGTCGAQANSSVVAIASSPPASIAVGPSGFFVAEQLVPLESSAAHLGAIGVIQPSSALNPGSVVGGNYFGFIYEPAVVASPSTCTSFCLAPTQLVQFANTTCPSGTTPPPTGMCGGTFQNDAANALNNDLLLNLGSEDPTESGLYKTASLQIPDPLGVCSPTLTCTLPAVAVVGNPEGSFSIFLIAQDTVNDSPLVVSLFQQ